MERTKKGRDINRHNYSLDEIKVEIQEPAVRRLLNLMEFRNGYPAFNGQFVIAKAPDDQLKLLWSQASYHTTATIDLKSYKFQIEYYDWDQRQTKNFRPEPETGNAQFGTRNSQPDILDKTHDIPYFTTNSALLHTPQHTSFQLMSYEP
ncbi:MAG: hypothetical protein V2I56_12705 [Desulfobacteraceae bacterium]|nr:hypothetical protein [Desulfobacteraceae bacterium]